MPDVFLSYSREDQPTARRFAEALQREGFSVWWDQSLDAGEAFDRVTEKALDDARAVVVLWSKRSVDSNWVRAEATQAHANHRLVPVMIEPCKRPIMFELTHTADLSGWNGNVDAAPWRAFIEGLRRSVGQDAKPSTPIAAPAPAHDSRRWITWGVAAAGFAMLVGVAWFFFSRTGPDATSASTGPIATSIAVLPFDDLSPEKDQQYFADGVAEEILNELARVDAKQLRVIARNSSFAFRGGDRNLKDVAETLGVDHVLEGSVRKAGSQLRISAQLINTRTDAHLWSHTYNSPLTDIFAVQEQIARSVADALQISLGVGIGGRPGMTRDVEAYEAYLLALTYRQADDESMRAARELLQRAVAKDPSFALAWMSLSNSYAGSAVLVPKSDAQDFQNRSDAALEQARRLQPDLPELLRTFANRSMIAGRWKEAMAHLQDFEVASEKYGTPENLRGRLLRQVGRMREALPLLEAYKARDPLNPEHSSELVVAYTALGNRSAAYSELSRIYPGERAPTLGRLAAMHVALNMRDRDLLLRVLDDGIAIERPQRVDFYAPVKELLDKPDEAIAFLRPWVNVESNNQSLIGSRIFLAYFGDADGALEALTLLTQRDGMGLGVLGNVLGIWGPLHQEMRRLPGFKKLMRDSGMLDYWREFGWGDYCKPTVGDDFECN